jgi:hypothetical protein
LVSRRYLSLESLSTIAVHDTEHPQQEEINQEVPALSAA